MEEPLLYINVPGLEHYPHVTYTWVIMIVLAISSYLVGRRITLIPEGGGQNFFEAAVEWIANFMEENIGHGGSKYPIL